MPKILITLMKNKFKKYAKVLLGLLLLVLVVSGVVMSQNNNSNGKKYDPYVVKRMDLSQSIDVSGTLEPTASIKLSFRKSGQVRDIYVNEGIRVTDGQVIASLDNAQEQALLNQAKAQVGEAQANLNLQLALSKDEDIKIAQANLQQAEANMQKADVDLANANSNLENVKVNVDQDYKIAELDLKNAELNLKKIRVQQENSTQQDASSVENSVVGLKTSMGSLLTSYSSSLQIVDKIFGIKGPSIFSDKKYLINDGSPLYVETRTLLIDNQNKYEDLKSSYDALGLTPEADDLLSLKEDFSSFNKVQINLMLKSAQVIDDVILSDAFKYTDLDKLRSDISNSTVALNTAITNYDNSKKLFDQAVLNKESTDITSPIDIETAKLLVDQKQQALERLKVSNDTQITNAENNVKIAIALLEVQRSMVASARANLDKVLASPRAVDVAPYRARVAQASAQLDKVQADYDLTLIKAPQAGLITKRDVEVGEQVNAASASADKVAFQMIDDGKYHIDVNVPETQISRISQDSKVVVSFDAFDAKQTFEGQILTIEPAGEEIDGVVYYTVKVSLKDVDPRLRVGMTADLTISAESRLGALAIPERAIQTIDGRKVVLMPDGDTRTKKVFVRTGARGQDGLIEVLDGLQEEDQVLISK